ncbi:hypothetical protein D3C83_136210 [compost metagenome]
MPIGLPVTTVPQISRLPSGSSTMATLPLYSGFMMSSQLSGGAVTTAGSYISGSEPQFHGTP